MGGFGETDFSPTSETTFWSPATGARLPLELDANGNVTRATLLFRGQEMIALPN